MLLDLSIEMCERFILVDMEKIKEESCNFHGGAVSKECILECILKSQIF